MKSFRENIIKYGILSLILILPVLFSSNLAFPYISIKTYLFYGITEFVFVFWLYTLLVDKSYRLDRKQLLFFIPVILYIAWMSIAGILAYNPSLSFWGPMERGTGILNLYHLFIFSLVVTSLIKHDGKVFLIKLLKSFLFSSFILALSVWLGNEGLNLQYDVFTKSSGGGLVGNSSLTSAYLIFSLFFCFYSLFEKEISKKWKIFITIIFFTILFSPLFINIYGLFNGVSLFGSARGSILGIIVGLGITILGYLFLSKNKILKIFGIIGIFISITTFFIGWNQFIKPDTYLHNKFIDVASDNRFLFWNIAQKSIDQHPWFGYGPENYMIAFQKNFDIRILDSNHSHEAWSDKAHNIYFDTGVSGGYPGITLYGILLLSIFYGIYSGYKKGKISRLQAGVLWGMLSGYIFQNLFVFDSLVSLLALFIIIAIVFSWQGDDIKEKYTKVNIYEIYRNIIAVFLLILFIFTFINFSYLPLKKAREFSRILSLNIDKRPAEYMSLIGGSQVGNDWDASYFAYNTIYLVYTKQIKSLQNNPKIINYVDADLTSYLVYLNKLAETNKTDSRLYLSMLHIYCIKMNVLNKKFEPVEYEHILSIADYAHNLSPMDPQIYWDLGFLKSYQGDLNGALEEYKKAIYLDKTSKISWIMILNFLKMTNTQSLYDLTLKEAQKSISDFKM
jgi:O-antigen ligase